MKRLLMIPLLLLLPGCKKAPPKTEPAVKSSVSKPAVASKKNTPKKPSTTVAKSKKVKTASLSKAQRKEYFTQLNTGRKLARKKLWTKAIVSFRAALKVLPMDGRALSELGWAAFQAGDFVTAREANRKSVLAATEDKVKAASLYNLGRTAEAMGKKDQAADFYRRSVILRPNDVVAKRLYSLGKKLPVSAIAPQLSETCAKKEVASVEAICACLKKEGSDDGGGKSSCSRHKQKTYTPTLVVLAYEVPVDRSITYFLAGKSSAKKWKILAQIGYVYNPGAFGIHEEFSFVSTKVEKVGSRRLLHILTKKDRSDSDMGIAEMETSTVSELTTCILPETNTKAPRCPLQVQLENSYLRERVEAFKDGLSAKEWKAKAKTLPIRKQTKLKVIFGADGRANIQLAGGQKSSHAAKQIGSHKLW